MWGPLDSQLGYYAFHHAFVDGGAVKSSQSVAVLFISIA